MGALAASGAVEPEYASGLDAVPHMMSTSNKANQKRAAPLTRRALPLGLRILVRLPRGRLLEVLSTCGRNDTGAVHTHQHRLLRVAQIGDLRRRRHALLAEQQPTVTAVMAPIKEAKLLRALAKKEG